MGETLWMYALYMMLTLSMKPSIEYTLFLRSLHCGDKVFILSECFNGTQTILMVRAKNFLMD